MLSHGFGVFLLLLMNAIIINYLPEAEAATTPKVSEQVWALQNTPSAGHNLEATWFGTLPLNLSSSSSFCQSSSNFWDYYSPQPPGFGVPSPIKSSTAPWVSCSWFCPLAKALAHHLGVSDQQTQAGSSRATPSGKVFFSPLKDHPLDLLDIFPIWPDYSAPWASVTFLATHWNFLSEAYRTTVTSHDPPLPCPLHTQRLACQQYHRLKSSPFTPVSQACHYSAF